MATIPSTLSRYLFDLGLLTEIDGDALAIYCQAWADWVAIQRELKPDIGEDGKPILKDIQLKHTIDAAGNEFLEIKSNPRVKTKLELWKIMKSYLAEFGMTPSSRSRIGVQPKGAKQEGVEQYLT